MKVLLVFSLFGLIAGLIGPAHANDEITVSSSNEPENKPEVWLGSISLSLISNNGNSRKQYFSARTHLEHNSQWWRSTFRLEGVNETTEENRSAEKYFASVKFDRNLSDIDYWLILLEYENDRFSSYEYQSSLSSGYGRKLIQNERYHLEVEAGPGYRYSVFQDNEIDVEKEMTFRAAVIFDWTLNETTSLKEVLSIEAAEGNTISKLYSAYESKLNGSLALLVSYEVKHVSSVSVDTQKVDSIMTVALSYSF